MCFLIKFDRNIKYQNPVRCVPRCAVLCVGAQSAVHYFFRTPQKVSTIAGVMMVDCAGNDSNMASYGHVISVCSPEYTALELLVPFPQYSAHLLFVVDFSAFGTL